MPDSKQGIGTGPVLVILLAVLGGSGPVFARNTALKHQPAQDSIATARSVELLAGLLKRNLAHKADQEPKGTFLHHAYKQREAELSIMEGIFRDQGPFKSSWQIASSSFHEAVEPLLSNLTTRLSGRSLALNALSQGSGLDRNVASPRTLVPIVADFLLTVDPRAFSHESLVHDWMNLLTAPNLLSLVPTSQTVSDGELFRGVLHGVHPGWMVDKITVVDGMRRKPFDVFTHDLSHVVTVTKSMLDLPYDGRIPSSGELGLEKWQSLMHGAVIRVQIADLLTKGMEKIEREQGSVVAARAKKALGKAAQSTDGFPDSIKKHLDWIIGLNRDFQDADNAPGPALMEVVDSLVANPRLERPVIGRGDGTMAGH